MRRRHRFSIGRLVILAIVLAGCVAAFLYFYHQRNPSCIQWRATGGSRFAELQYLPGDEITAPLGKEGLVILSADGRELRRFSCGQDLRDPVRTADGQTLYYADPQGILRAVDCDGNELWSLQFPGGIRFYHLWLVNGVLYTSDDTGAVHAVSTDGTELWSFRSAGFFLQGPAVCPATGRTYFGTTNPSGSPCDLYCIAPDGSVVWQAQLPESPASAPLVTSTGNLVVGLRAQGIQTYDPDGNLLWSALPGMTVLGDPVEDDQGTIYCGAGNGSYHALNHDGTVRWSVNLKHPGDIQLSLCHPCIIRDGKVYLATGATQAQAPSFGMMLRMRLASNSIPIGPGRLYILDAATGATLWEYETKCSIEGKPVVGPDGTVYVATWEPEVLAIRPPV